MSDLILKRCPICIEAIPFDRVLFLQCGHKACATCIAKLDSGERGHRNGQTSECFECRKPIVETPHRVYLSMDEIRQFTEKGVIVGLQKIDMNTPADSVQKAASKIRHAEQRSKGDSATSAALLLATKDLEERIAPLFRRWQEVKKENDDLRDRLNVLHDESLAAKEKAKKERAAIRDEREESQRLAQKVGTYRAMLKGKDGEVAKLKTELEERDKKVALMKAKLKVLVKKQKHDAPLRHDPDASLQIEKDIVITRRKRSTDSLLHDLKGDSQITRVKRRKDSVQ